MWISKAEYEKLKNRAESNERDAEMYRYLFQPHTKNEIRFYNEFVIVKYDFFKETLNKQNAEEDKVKELQAELEWYKVKYHEMKMNRTLKIKF